MEKYILDLISENNRVIIPNFGAFIVSKENGVSILFNNFLSFNDGLLVNYLAEQKGIDTIVATDQVFEFVDQLKKELDELGTYTIKKLGTFKKDENGILRFQQDDNFSEVLDEGTKVASEDIDVTDRPVEDDASKKVFILDVEKDEETISNKTIGEKPIVKEESKEEVESESNKKESVKTIIVPPTSTSTSPRSTPTEPAPMKKEEKVPIKKAETPRKTKKKNDDKGVAAIIVVVAIIISAVGAYFLFFNKPEAPKPVAKKTITQPVKKPIVKDTIAIKPEVEKPKPVEKPKVDPSQALKGRFYIIVGGFKEVNNAYKMVDDLKGKGYSKAQMIVKDNMHLVSIDSDVSYKKVEAKQQEILSAQIESWLYKIK